MKRDLIGLGLVAGAILVFCHTILWVGASPFGGDISLQFYPWKCYTQSMLAQGQIPYWNPYTFGGVPFLANIQSAVFYPLDLILFLFPVEWFYGLSLVLHLLLAGTGAYLFARICGATAFPSAIAGIAYGLNGFTMIHIPAGNHLTYAGAAWVPWMLWATVGFVKTQKSRLPWVLTGSFIAFLHFLCGHPQMMFYSLVFSFFLCLCYGIWNEGYKDQPNRLAAVIRTFVWSSFLVLGIFMAGAQLIPTMQYLAEAGRASSLDLQMATEFSFAPHRLITLFAPEYYGNMFRGTHYDSFVFWSCAYAGFIIPLLALTPIFRAVNRFPAVIPLAVIAFLGLLFAWGRDNPFYAFMYQFPGFGHFRAPAKYIPYYLAPVCVLAALGIESLAIHAYEKLQKTRPGFIKQSVRILLSLVMLAGLVFCLLHYGTPFLTGLSGEQVVSITDRLFGSNLEGKLSEPGMTDTARIQCVVQLASNYRMVVLFLSCLIGYWAARLVPKSPRMMISLTLGFILFFDLAYFGWNYLNVSLVSLDSIRASTVPPAQLSTVRPPRNTPSPDRIMNLKDVDMPNVFMHWKVYNIAGYDPMSLRSYNQPVGVMENWKTGEYHDNIQLTQIDHPLLDTLNVRYVFTRKKIDSPRVVIRAQGDEFLVYERMSENRTWAAIPSDQPADSQTVKWIPADSRIKMKTYDPHEIVFAFSPDTKVMMRVAEWDYPGWCAEALLADGGKRALGIKPSKEGLRTFSVPANAKEIRLYYTPPWSGWLLSAVSILLFVLLVIFVFISRTDWFLFFMQKAMGRNF